MSGLKSQIVSGIGWSGISQIGRQVLQFGIGVILARLLSPAEFGLIGMVLVFTGFASLFGDLGLGAAIVHKQDLEHRHLNAVFWTNIVAGMLLTSVMILGAPWIARFYDQAILKPLTIVIAFQFLLGSLNIVQGAQLQKRMDFRTLSIIEMITQLCAGIVGIAMAFKGFGVWSLVVPGYTAGMLAVGWMWKVCPWRPHLTFSWTALKELLGFSGNLLGFSMLNYWIRNLDNLLIGRFVGSAALGVYSRAYSLMLMPLTQISGVLSRVMFPALSTIQKDTARIKDVYLRSISMIGLITFPLMVGLFVTAEAFVRGLFGEQWSEVVPILKVFCLVGLAQSIGTTVGWIYQALGRTDVMFKWGIFSGVVFLTAFGIGIQWGIMGVTWAYAVASLGILAYPSFAIPGRFINLRVIEIIRRLAATFWCAAFMGLGVWFVGHILPATWPHWAYLVVQVPLGVVLYGALVHLFKLSAYREVRELVSERFGAWRLERQAILVKQCAKRYHLSWPMLPGAIST